MPLQHTKAVCWQTAGSVTMLTTFRFMEYADTLALQQALAVEVKDNLIMKMKSHTSAAWKLISIVVSNESDLTISPYNLPTNEVGSGTQTAHQIAVQFNLLSGIHGRRGKGRVYIGGSHTNAWVDGLLSGTALAQLQSNVAGINARFAVGGTGAWHLGIYSRLNNTLAPMAEMTLSRIPATLRSRKIGSGI